MTLATPKRFTIEEYHRLGELRFLTEDDRVELIRGIIMQMASKSTAHSSCCSNILMKLATILTGHAILQCQDPVVLTSSNSEPEPDFAILRMRDDNYSYALPNSSDVLLIIEISDFTLKYDREIKYYLYAEAGMSDYWILNLVDNHLEVHSEPYEDLQGKFGYAMKRIILPNQTVALPGFPDLSLDLSEIFSFII